MKSLAQIRATNALLAKDRIGRTKKDGDAVKGYPTLVKTNGLLPALCFAIEPGKSGLKHECEGRIGDAIAEHLSTDGIGITEAADAASLVEELAHASDASQLRRATAEALAYLNYLKRFVA